jgi:enoyl-CoA hydratase
MVLTGARLSGAECHYLGLATHYVPPAALEELVERITKMPGRLAGVLGAASVSVPDSRIADNMALITRNFASDTLEEIEEALEADGGEWATAELATLRTKSPLSSKVSLRLLAEGAERRSFADEMIAEYALATRVVHTQDFAEGVRALLIDKDNEPQWDPPMPGAVPDDMLDALFEPLPADQAWTPFPGE